MIFLFPRWDMLIPWRVLLGIPYTSEFFSMTFRRSVEERGDADAEHELAEDFPEFSYGFRAEFQVSKRFTPNRRA